LPVPRKRKAKRKKMLPDGWKRIGRPETERRPGSREMEDHKVWEHRKKDRAGRWLCFITSIWGVEEGLCIKLVPIIRQAMERNKNGKASALDLGCAAGTSLGDLKTQFKDKIRTVGQVLERTPGEKYEGVDRLVDGELTEIQMMEKFDLIYSYSASVRGTYLKATAVGKVIEWLKPGGTAALDIGGLINIERSYIQEITTVLRANGIKRWNFTASGALVFKKPVVKLPG